MNVIREVLARYDVVGIQELSQKPEAPYKGPCGGYTGTVVCAMNPNPDEYDITASPYITDEQYVLMIRRSDGKVVATDTYPDPNKLHTRPPHVFQVEFSKGGEAPVGMAVAVTHTTPGIATQEITNFPEVLAWMRTKFTNAPHFMIAGDFNADGSYFKDTKIWPESKLDSSFAGYSMLTPNDLDTTVGATRNCYDRIIVDDALAKQSDRRAKDFELEDIDLLPVRTEGCKMGYVSGPVCDYTDKVSWSAMPEEAKRDVAKVISDHQPVEVCLRRPAIESYV